MRYLTKSRFKLGMECPRKLYYYGKKEYINKSLEDPFLQALASGGFQVGELAKLYYPGGIEIKSSIHQEALEETNKLLEQDNVILYEAAVKYENLFARIDILEKIGNWIRIIEVKSKSISKDEEMEGKRVPIKAEWQPYIEDIAFQNYIMKKTFPTYQITPYLMLVDKDAKCPSDGLNQKFKISKDDRGNKYVDVSDAINEEDLSTKILIEKNMEDLCGTIYEDVYECGNQELKFSEIIDKLSEAYEKDLPSLPNISKNCKSCEFKANQDELNKGFKSGFRQCFTEVYQWDGDDFQDDDIFTLWDNRRTDAFIEDGKLKLRDLSQSDIGYKADDKPGLSRTERQWLQIDKSVNNKTSYWIDKENLKREMSSWTFPLHFIDFETAAPAIPFKKGKKPYEGIAFQFSHHIVDEEGNIEHTAEYLNTRIGENPYYDFVRKLKETLGKDQGTSFKYSNHENTYLNMIHEQLVEEEESIPDKEDLLSFIREITEYGPSKERVKGARNMVDMLELVKRYYYDPFMAGSNSIKQVLPAVLNSSDFIKKKYSKPIYGAEDGIKSHNFKDWTWIKIEDGKVADPYRLLPKLFDDVSEKDYEILNIEDELSDGGAAMTAYYRLQFEDITDDIREQINQGLLRYCELDTLAMVMIYEAWVDMTK